jgi:hypothetical protein
MAATENTTTPRLEAAPRGRVMAAAAKSIRKQINKETK